MSVVSEAKVSLRGATPGPAAESPFHRVVTDFLANPVAIFGLTLLGTILFLALFAPLQLAARINF